MAARPIAAYKKMTIVINGVTKNVIVPVRSPASRQNEKDTVETDNDECVITEVEALGTVASSERSQFLPEQSDIHSTDPVVEPIEISPNGNGPIYHTIDLTISPNKVVESCEISRPAQNKTTDTDITVAAGPDSRSTRGIPITFSLCCNASTSTVPTANAVVLSDAQQGLRNIVASTSAVCNAECHLQSQFSQCLTSTTSADPVVIAPPLGTEVSSLSVISSPRTMTKQEAIAAGWFNEEPVVDNNFVSSVELVSLETENDINGNSTHLELVIENHEEIVPLISSAEEMPDSCATSLMRASGTSGNPVSCDCGSEIDESTDRKPHIVADLTKPCQNLEKLLDDDGDENGYNYGTLMSEEDEPLTAVMEGMESDNATHDVSTKVTPVTSKKTEAVRRGPGRPPKCNSHENVKTNKAKRTGGRPLTAAEQYHLKDCGVWLQELRLSAATVKARAVWRYLCCRDLMPRVAGSCGLCHGRRISESVIELEVAKKFRAGSHECAKAAKSWREFSLDPHLLQHKAANKSKKSPSKMAQMSDSGPSDPSSHENKKYLVIQTETGTFVVPVESAVGCIVSEQEIAQMLSSQTVPSSTSYAGEFSNETLLAACSQMEQSSSHKTAVSNNKTLSAEERNKSPLAASRGRHKQLSPLAAGRGRHKQLRRRRSTTNDSSRSDSLPRRLRSKSPTRLRSVRNTATTVSQVSKRKRLSAADLLRKARRSFRGTTPKGKPHDVGLKGGSYRQQNKAKRKKVR